MSANVTPRVSRRQSISPLELSPEKKIATRKHDISGVQKPLETSQQPSGLLTWSSSDATPMPEEGILRGFDLNMSYGPCCSLSREERWLRAKSLGLNPPDMILDIIKCTKNNVSVLDYHMAQIASSQLL